MWLTVDDGTRLWFDRVGGGSPPPAGRSPVPVVLLCPPGGRNARYWPDEVLQAGRSGGASVVVFDWRGQGRSDWPPGPLDPQRLVADVAALCDRLAGPAGAAVPLTLVGAGLGGWVAARVAQQRRAAGAPARRVVLVASSACYHDPALPGPSEPVVVSLVLRRRGGGAAELARALGREVAVEAASPGTVDGARFVAEAEAWIDHGYNPEDGHRVAWLAAPPLPGEPLGGQAPPVVVHGEADPVVPVVHGRHLAELVGAELVVVPGAGHHLSGALAAAVASVLHGADLPDADLPVGEAPRSGCGAPLA